ncbi:hypothetical protein TNCT_666771 [Trichonephila clavata]|uniref:Transposase n=1 Tax=Trichonephila clavata TaxID=2740835 RepID=A0A8X6KND1_TRICU|nr:hypothetical protein TNCT_666771 [Trichonephila clavata]
MEIDHEPGAGHPVYCDVEHLWQEIDIRSTSMVQRLGTEPSVSTQTISRHLTAIGCSEKTRNIGTTRPNDGATSTAPGDQ